MLRTADRRATPIADRAAADLLDRTGIIAASLPRGRRSPEDTDIEDTQPIPVVPGGVTRPGPGAAAAGAAGAALAGAALIGSRPRAVVVRRRKRAWVGGGAALALVALGWLGGGLFGGSVLSGSTDDAVAQSDQRTSVAQPQPAPQPAPVVPPAPAPAAAPVTVYVPVPSPSKPVKHSPVKPPASRASSVPDGQDTARVDTKPAPTSTSQAPANSFQEYVDQWAELANRMSGGR